jgi:hypothetical protein
MRGVSESRIAQSDVQSDAQSESSVTYFAR